MPSLPVWGERSSYYTKKVSETTAYSLGLGAITTIHYQPEDEGEAANVVVQPEWEIRAEPPIGLEVVTTDAAFTWAGALVFVRDGVVFRGFNPATAGAQAVGAASGEGRITLGQTAPGAANAVVWHNLAHDRRGGLDVFGGVFRTPVAPLQAGQFQLMEGEEVGTANSGGVISGDFSGLVDFERGICAWTVADLGTEVDPGTPVRADQLTYNAVFLQYVPLNEALLGVGTTRLPVDGRVPGFHEGEHVVVHETVVVDLPNPITKGTAYDLGIERIAHVTLRDLAGLRVPGSLFELDHDAGLLTVPVGSDIAAYTQPFKAHVRYEDELLVMRLDLSGRIDLAATLTHNYTTAAWVSSKQRMGDRFARAHNYKERVTWNTGGWDATAAGSQTAAQFDSDVHPIQTTNRGAITERWWCVFQNTTHVNVYGERTGMVANNVPIANVIEVVNPRQSPALYFSIPPGGWGGGWAAGNVFMFETQACGGQVWVTRATLPGSSAVYDDKAVIALRSDVDRLPA